MPIMPTQQEIEKQIIGKRVVAVAWVPVSDVDGLFAVSSITLEGGLTLDFQGSYYDAVYARITDHADA